MSESQITRDHDTIQQWAQAREGEPAVVRSVRDNGMLRIDFPGGATRRELERISWDEFFQIFDDRDLCFLYQETLSNGNPSRFCKFVSSER